MYVCMYVVSVQCGRMGAALRHVETPFLKILHRISHRLSTGENINRYGRTRPHFILGTHIGTHISLNLI